MRHAELALVVVGGGSSVRFEGGNKLLEPLCGEPVFVHCLRRLSPVAASTILVVPRAQRAVFEKAVETAGLDDVSFADGGACRAESVRNGVAMVPAGIGYVAVHDAARPLVPGAHLEAMLALAEECKCGVVSGRNLVDSLKKLDEAGEIVCPVPRDMLFRAETPQLFPIDDLRQALSGNLSAELTDDAEAMRLAGFRSRTLVNPFPNPKITVRSDIDVVRRLMEIELDAT